MRTTEQLGAKLPFRFDSTSNLNEDRRQSRALEHIAHYLDRIESHLEVIANASASGGFNEGLRMELLTIREILQKRLPSA